MKIEFEGSAVKTLLLGDDTNDGLYRVTHSVEANYGCDDELARGDILLVRGDYAINLTQADHDIFNLFDVSEHFDGDVEITPLAEGEYIKLIAEKSDCQ